MYLNSGLVYHSPQRRGMILLDVGIVTQGGPSCVGRNVEKEMGLRV